LGKAAPGKRKREGKNHESTKNITVSENFCAWLYKCASIRTKYRGRGGGDRKGGILVRGGDKHIRLRGEKLLVALEGEQLGQGRKTPQKVKLRRKRIRKTAFIKYSPLGSGQKLIGGDLKAGREPN